MNDDIIAWLVYKHMNVKPMVVQKLDAKVTMLVLPEGDEVEKVFGTLQSIEMSLGCSVKVGCYVATPMKVSMGDQLQWVGRDEGRSGENVN